METERKNNANLLFLLYLYFEDYTTFLPYFCFYNKSTAQNIIDSFSQESAKELENLTLPDIF